MSTDRGGAAKRKLGLISLGCAKNLVDSEVMLGHLAQEGWEFTQNGDDADVLVVNTCSFIGPARDESIRTILEAAELKKTGKLKRLIVAGCMVQRYPDELRSELSEVDEFIDLDQLDRVVGAADPRAVSHKGLPLIGVGVGASRYLYDDRTPRRLSTPAWTAFVKIAEGCDHTCSFCAIPSFRGKFRSRRPSSVLREARALAEQGVREINLIAQDSSHYGRDIEMDDGLARLLDELDMIDALRWIRVHYLYPNTVTPRLIEAFANGKRVLDYVDMPLQHAHADTLRRMRRGGSADSHLDLLGRFRDAMPHATLRSTFIVGYPGETEAEFDALMQFIGEARFDHLGVFLYSHEEQTGAHAVDDDVPQPLKQERHDRLMALQQEIVLARHASRIGDEVEVLVEGAHPETEHLLVGRTRGQAPDVDGQILINDGHAAPGEFVTVRLDEVAGYDLVGGIVAGG